MVIKRFIQEEYFKFTKEDLQQDTHIWVYYGSNNYNNDLKHLLTLKAEVLKDYPEVTDDEMHVECISSHDSRRHAGFTMLHVAIPIDVYFNHHEVDNIFIL